jgi:hypothetical protein
MEVGLSDHSGVCQSQIGPSLIEVLLGVMVPAT